MGEIIYSLLDAWTSLEEIRIAKIVGMLIELSVEQIRQCAQSCYDLVHRANEAVHVLDEKLNLAKPQPQLRYVAKTPVVEDPHAAALTKIL